MDKQIIQPKSLKGFRDFLPEDALKRKYVKDKIETVFQLYGFNLIETPAVEYLETFTGNIGEDEKLFFKFEDQGGRKVALRYDQTVPTCRFIAQYKDKLTFPFKRYQIQTVWRAENTQKGRYREFFMCDADIFGVSGPEADAESIALSLDVFKALGFKNYVVKVNDREIYKDIPYEVIVAIDKLKKIGREGVIAEIVRKGSTQEKATEMLDKVLNAKPTERLNAIFGYLKALGVREENYSFDPSIARSFNYSTGPIWEIVVHEYSTGSLLGGERYDKLIGRFQNEDIPGTGFAVGFDRTLDAMEDLGLLPDLKSSTKVLVTIFSEDLLPLSLRTAQKLREAQINTDVYTDPSVKLDKQLKYTNKLGIPFAVIIGPEEVEKNLVQLKNMKTGQQQSLSLEDLLGLVKNA